MYSHLSSQQGARDVQIQQLFRACPSATIRNPDKSVIDLLIRVNDPHKATGDIVTIRIYLPPQFPKVPPQITIPAPKVTHPWVDGHGRVIGSASLFGWNPNSSSLAITATEVLNEFLSNPPQVVPTQHQQATINGPPAYATAKKHGLSPSKRKSEDEHLALPPIPNEFECLKGLSLKELTELKDDDKKFDKFFENLDMVKSPAQIRDDMHNNNIEQAKKNLSYKDRIEQLQNELLALKEKAEVNRLQFDEVALRQEKILERYDAAKLLKLLEDKAEDMDECSENIAEKFSNGQIPVHEFVKDYMELRQLYHLRRAKATQLQQQLKKG